MSKKELGKAELILSLIIIVAVVGALIFPIWLTDFLIELLISAFVGAICSFLAALFVESVSGSFFKKFAFDIELFGLNFSVTAFAIITFLVKVWWFGFP